MKKVLGIRREDKNKWERGVPIIPEDLKGLKDVYEIDAIVQPRKFQKNNGSIRVIRDGRSAYRSLRRKTMPQFASTCSWEILGVDRCFYELPKFFGKP